MSYNESNTTATPAVSLNSTLENNTSNSTDNAYNPTYTNRILFIIFFIIYLIVKFYTGRFSQYARHRQNGNNHFDLISIDSGYFENIPEDEQEENVD
ncbi:hypothetical protein PGAL8A_00321900 [Plasmodium gallinaceum]|uniref:Uncharacterized protein n=1 Tax=Plasmodium gallinaceum TaxID=5849 RepID=A0A1J1GXJ1_PLAGA|nr:hypothetical protein PGAL8A_00321900 [Plasmodium gallinaceum]CRG96005.1 hypothetical protein PGAL8A_00321900 [Plasmodium gallinaceum]